MGLEALRRIAVAGLRQSQGPERSSNGGLSDGMQGLQHVHATLGPEAHCRPAAKTILVERFGYVDIDGSISGMPK